MSVLSDDFVREMRALGIEVTFGPCDDDDEEEREWQAEKQREMEAVEAQALYEDAIERRKRLLVAGCALNGYMAMFS